MDALGSRDDVWSAIGTGRAGGAAESPGASIREDIAALIHDGIAVPGTRLPTVRGLAERLGVAPNTVAKAYRALEADGVIETRGRAGSFVGTPESARDAGLAAAAAEFVRVARGFGASDAEVREAVRAALAE